MIGDRSSSTLLCIAIVLFTFLPNWELLRVADGKVHITDDLDDVVDDEEDDAWKDWGKKKTPEFDLPAADLNKMELPEIQQQLMKQHVGPLIGFVKLRLGVRRTSVILFAFLIWVFLHLVINKGSNRQINKSMSPQEMITELAMKWTKVLRTGALGVKFTGVDISTIMFNINKGQDISDFKEFILNQPEAYEVKLGDQVFRRDGDPPLEVVMEKLRREKEAEEEEENAKEEL